MKIRFTLIVILLVSTNLFAHPNGNIIVTKNGCVLWPYVSPVGDIAHHASIMLWDQKSEPRLFLKSEYEASDFFLYTQANEVFIIERKYVSSNDIFESRILKTSTNFEHPKVIWPWFEDKWHVGVGGFKMRSDDKLIFVKYPNIYLLQKNENPTVFFDFSTNINKMRPVSNERLLLLGEGSAWLTDTNGKVIKQWDNLIEDLQGNSPLNRNVVHDIDYANGDLLLAYWGKRTFEIIDVDNKRKTLLSQENPWVPHWVAYLEGDPLLFSSYLDFKNGFTENMKKTTIKPLFILYSNKKQRILWEEN